MSKLIEGAIVSEQVLKEVQHHVESVKGHRPPCLAVILVGNDPASSIYVARKQKVCGEIGIRSIEYKLSETSSNDEVRAVIESLNQNPDVDGILLQVPLPKHLDESMLLQLISVDKDVDGFHPENMGRLLLGRDGYRPCTPAGVIELLRFYNLKAVGKHVVIVGRSNIVGKPQAALFLLNDDFGNATVTICHSKSKNLHDLVKQGDIVVAALGKPQFITADMIKPGAVVVDVGINRIEDKTSPRGYRIVGDVDFESVKTVAGWITPVPGGVGPMTIAMLMKNTWQAYQNHQN